MSASKIRYLQHADIDKAKWDHRINTSPNNRIYAYSFYLDTMAKHWDAMVYGDYEAVMPLTWNEKFAIRYMYQPFLTAQLGIFGKIDDSICLEMIEAIPTSFRFIDINLNSGNFRERTVEHIRKRNNYILPLQGSYEKIYSAYSENLKRNIKKATQAGCVMQKDFDVEDVIRLAVSQMDQYGKESSDNVERFRKLYSLLHQKGNANTYGIFSTENKLLASAVFSNEWKGLLYSCR